MGDFGDFPPFFCICSIVQLSHNLKKCFKGRKIFGCEGRSMGNICGKEQKAFKVLMMTDLNSSGEIRATDVRKKPEKHDSLRSW